MSEDYAKYLGLDLSKLDKNYIVNDLKDKTNFNQFYPHEGIRFTFDFIDYVDALSHEDQKNYFDRIFEDITENMSYKYSNIFYETLNNISLYSYRNKVEPIYSIDGYIKNNNIEYNSKLYTHESNIQLSEEDRQKIEIANTENDMILLMGFTGIATPATYTYVINKLIKKDLIKKIKNKNNQFHQYIFTDSGNNLYNFLKEHYNLNIFLSTKYKQIIYEGITSNKIDLEILKELADYYNMSLYVSNNKIYSSIIKEEKFNNLDYNYIDKQDYKNDYVFNLI
jgi:DNA-binding MarR family transcriptional regulator